MGHVIIQKETTVKPITLIGKEAGVCYGSNTTDDTKNYRRGLINLKSNHARTFEYPQIYMVLEGYSARVMRELYTHIGGGPTRLQASTRYIDYDNFGFITPPAFQKDDDLREVYLKAMRQIKNNYATLLRFGATKEDAANILPFGMTTTVVVRTNLRQLMDMIHTRLCSRAYWEFRQLIKDIILALKEYSEEWDELAKAYFVPKCKYYGYCTEEKSCGAVITKEKALELITRIEDDLK